ncbi:Lrp/AsnC family transcriptional regulator [Rhizobium lentis]|uniref:Lrp/AsnC family transcriptional regulator n=1 Tax=Rhizobium lentis TaxID=1138194 RepID=A0ABS7ILZ8_9HYPH|nr:Lrp/AsnC family transcriptional regulator [Rhizobium lentis]MBX4959616.1 Lrp/AsnC family transcriptional regulator [Rhizobium lentis]MBX4973232.1 Lrp/AsnC family transcriptional regulator [Rhizobium lentis]MBX4989748.1 Lrp/AsnC family transcriptional regulator [Rhizobium lentis]MBX5001690.1 Lrp/AsnC family transcriptional regulator [Rhizobium lentis]MBX5008065.1 Lrp/AsnC family transcriptional regulator [Rhizobium lentis]
MSKAKIPQNLQTRKSTLDEIDARILSALNSDARLSISELARLVGMSPPSVSDRIRRLEAAGVIRGFTVDVDTRAIGYQIRAIVRIRPLPGKLHLVERLIQERPEFIECDKITGDDPFLARLAVHSIEQMDDVLETLSEHAVTSTAVVKGTSVKKRLPPL